MMKPYLETVISFGLRFETLERFTMRKPFFHHNIFTFLRSPFNSRKRKEIRKSQEDRNNRWRVRKFGNETLLALQKAIKSSPNQAKIWLEFGTLLGIYRDKKLIAHDNDIDLGINEEDCTPELIAHFEKYGFKLLRKYVIESKNAELNNFTAEYTFRYKNKFLVDLFVFKQDKNKKSYYYFEPSYEEGLTKQEIQDKYNGLERTLKDELDDFKLETLFFLSEYFYVPQNIENHLSRIYGSDFMIPKQYTYGDRPKDRETILEPDTLGRKIEYK